MYSLVGCSGSSSASAGLDCAIRNDTVGSVPERRSAASQQYRTCGLMLDELAGLAVYEEEEPEVLTGSPLLPPISDGSMAVAVDCPC